MKQFLERLLRLPRRQENGSVFREQQRRARAETSFYVIGDPAADRAAARMRDRK